eukprot:1191940-Prorocentrum_minimum.AAC.3
MIPPGPVHNNVLQHPPTHTTSRSIRSLDYLCAPVEQLPGALLPTRMPSDALCLRAFSLFHWQTDGPLSPQGLREFQPPASLEPCSLAG